MSELVEGLVLTGAPAVTVYAADGQRVTVLRGETLPLVTVGEQRRLAKAGAFTGQETIDETQARINAAADDELRKAEQARVRTRTEAVAGEQAERQAVVDYWQSRADSHGLIHGLTVAGQPFAPVYPAGSRDAVTVPYGGAVPPITVQEAVRLDSAGVFDDNAAVRVRLQREEAERAAQANFVAEHQRINREFARTGGANLASSSRLG